jgi:ABC-2 type transport system ATP-binding protein
MKKEEEKTDEQDIAIKVEGVYKDFDLPHEKQNSLKYKIVHPFKSKTTIEKQHALKDISFEVKKGEFFGIVGRNGSGKSTLLKILAEIYTPTNGKVIVNGSLTPFIELGVGFNAELTGRENVYLNGAMLGFSTKEMEKMYDEIVEFAELEKFMDQKLKNYSSGMQVRLAFSVAIRAKSDILLLDEVLAVGDADFQRKCFNYFRTLKKEGKTVILVSHSMESIKQFCDKALLIKEGNVGLIDTPSLVSRGYNELFSEKSNDERTNKKRWGKSPNIFKQCELDVSKDSIRLKVKLCSDHDLIKPILGFILKNSQGISIAGSNSQLKGFTFDMDSNLETIISITMPNFFSDGRYEIDLAIVEEDGITVLDWWENIKSFNIKKEQQSTYLIDPNVNFLKE